MEIQNEDSETKTKINSNSKINLINFVEQKYFKNSPYSTKGEDLIQIGDIVRVGYTIQEGSKERTQYYEGLVIAQQNRGLGRTFTIRRMVQGIGVEQIFLLNSPKIISVVRKQMSKVRRAKLYFIRNLTGKSARLKRKL
jgi:large subunit ribosomal protein L19